MLHLHLGYGWQGFGLCPLGEIINCDDGILDLTLRYREWPDYFDTPLSKWLRVEDWGLLLCRAVDHVDVPLAFVILLDIILRVPSYGCPVVAV